MLSFSFVVQAVSVVFAILGVIILQTTRECEKNSAFYCCRKMAGHPLNEVTKHFGLSHYGSVSDSIAKFGREIKKNSHLAELVRKVENVKKIINKNLILFLMPFNSKISY